MAPVIKCDPTLPAGVPFPEESDSMITMLSRRSLFQVTAAGLGAFAVAHASALLAAEPRPRRKFKMALSCSMVGVRATPREAVELAHRYGFEAVEPSARFLAGLSDDSLARIGYDGPIEAEPFRPDLGTLPRNQAMETVAAAMKKAFALVESGAA